MSGFFGKSAIAVLEADQSSSQIQKFVGVVERNYAQRFRRRAEERRWVLEDLPFELLFGDFDGFSVVPRCVDDGIGHEWHAE